MAKLPVNAISWFEIPAADLERARRFYSAVLGNELDIQEASPGFPMGMFPVAEAGENIVGGALVAGEGYEPSAKGTMVYLTVADVEEALSRVESAGGKAPEEAFETPWGRMVFIYDSEGNRVALHQHALHT
jgi:hypothetical protein